MRAGSNPTDPRLDVFQWDQIGQTLLSMLPILSYCLLVQDLRQETAAGTDCPAFGARKGCNFASTWALQVKLVL